MRYVLDFRGNAVGGPVVPGKLVQVSDQVTGPEADANLRAEPKVTFLLHGFNVNREEGRTGLLNLADRLPFAGNGAVVATLWPGDHWVGFASFPFEGNDADDTAVELAQFITDVIDPETPISFVTHSLGARVAMETVEILLVEEFPVAQVCLMAAAIDDYSVSSEQDYRAAAEHSARVAVLSSREDEVLKYAYPARDLLESFVFFWRDSFGLALGYHGPKPSDETDGAVPDNVMHEAIPNAKNSNHGDYIPDPLPNANQRSAAGFANDVIAGDPMPRYR